MKYCGSVIAVGLISLITTPKVFGISTNIPTCNYHQSVFSTDVNQVVPDGVTSQALESTIEVSGEPLFVWDVDLKVRILSQASSDIDLSLTSPFGYTVTLTTDNGGNFANVFNGTLFDDQADQGNGSLSRRVVDYHYSNTVAQKLTPEEPLSLFRNNYANGSWILKIVDDTPGNQTTLLGWEIHLTSLNNPPHEYNFYAMANAHVTDIPDNGELVSTIYVGNGSITNKTICDLVSRTNVYHPNPGELEISLESPLGRRITIASLVGGNAANAFATTFWGDTFDYQNPVPYYDTPFLYVSTDYAFQPNVTAQILTPMESFSNFAGETGLGVWTLRIRDTAPGYSGYLDSWNIIPTPCDYDPVGGRMLVDGCDQCPDDLQKSSPGQCGCGHPDTDSDGDGVANCDDQCPNNPDKFVAGACGCASSDADSDGDGVTNCNESCAEDPLKTEPGVCGCGILDTDYNQNGIADCNRTADLKAQFERLKNSIAEYKKGGKLSKALSSKIKNLSIEIHDSVLGSIGGLDIKQGQSINLIASASSLPKRAKTLIKASSAEFFSAKKSLLKATVKGQNALE